MAVDLQGGGVPHAQRKLVSAACFNLAVCHVHNNKHMVALTCARMALILGEDKYDSDIGSYVRMQVRLHHLVMPSSMRKNDPLSRLTYQRGIPALMIR